MTISLPFQSKPLVAALLVVGSLAAAPCMADSQPAQPQATQQATPHPQGRSAPLLAYNMQPATPMNNGFTTNDMMRKFSENSSKANAHSANLPADGAHAGSLQLQKYQSPFASVGF